MGRNVPGWTRLGLVVSYLVKLGQVRSSSGQVWPRSGYVCPSCVKNICGPVKSCTLQFITIFWDVFYVIVFLSFVKMLDKTCDDHLWKYLRPKTDA